MVVCQNIRQTFYQLQAKAQVGGVSKYQTDVLSTSGYCTGWWCVKIDRRSINFRLRYRLVVCQNIRQTFYQLQATAQVGGVSKYQTDILSTSGYLAGWCVKISDTNIVCWMHTYYYLLATVLGGISKYPTQTFSIGTTHTLTFRLRHRLAVCQNIRHRHCQLDAHTLRHRLVVCKNIRQTFYQL